MVIGFSGLCIVAVCVLLFAEAGGRDRLKALAKTTASVSFVLVGVGALTSATGGGDLLPGRMILIGLVFCALGDVLLLSKRSSLFLAGMGAFGAGHLAYIGGFLSVGDLRLPHIIIGGLMAAAACVVPIGLMWRHLGAWRGPVAAYGVVIGVMVGIAIASGLSGAVPWMLTVAALAFAVSDISVAQDRLIRPRFALRLWGLPLYYGAQLLFALGSGSLA